MEKYISRLTMCTLAGHNVSPRGENGLCEQAWALMSVVHFIHRGTMTKEMAMDVGERLGLNPGNISTEFRPWRDAQELHGVTNLPPRSSDNFWTRPRSNVSAATTAAATAALG